MAAQHGASAWTCERPYLCLVQASCCACASCTVARNSACSHESDTASNTPRTSSCSHSYSCRRASRRATLASHCTTRRVSAAARHSRLAIQHGHHDITHHASRIASHRNSHHPSTQHIPFPRPLTLEPRTIRARTYGCAPQPHYHQVQTSAHPRTVACTRGITIAQQRRPPVSSQQASDSEAARSSVKWLKHGGVNDRHTHAHTPVQHRSLHKCQHRLVVVERYW
jgi:hypothetical protein